MSRTILPLVTKVEHKAGLGVDHTHGPVVSLSLRAKVKKGQETWCMNNSVLEDAELIDTLRRLIINMVNTISPVKNAIDTWLYIKKAIKGLLRRNGVHRANMARDRKLRIKKELENLARQALRDPQNVNILLQQTMLMEQDNSRVKDSLSFGKCKGA